MQNSSINRRTLASALMRGLLLLTLTTNVWAEGSPPVLEEAHRLLDAGHAEQSAALLESALLEHAGNTEFDYLLGSAWLRSGQEAKAMFAFERVLMSDQKHIDARLKAARISINRNDSGYVRELLSPLSTLELTASQQEELSQLRADFDAAARRRPISIRAYLLGSLGWDDNVTSGPDQSTLVIPALGSTPTALGTAARDQDITGAMEGGVSMQKALDADSWLTAESSIQHGYNRTRTDMTENVFNLNLGLLKYTGRERLGAALLAQDYQISNSSYRTLSGIRLSWAHSFTDNSSLGAYAQQLALNYPSNSTDNATRTVFGILRESSLIGSEGNLQYGIYGGKEATQNASRTHLGFQMLGASLGASMRFGKKLALSAGTIYESHNHDSVDALYLFTRIDSVRTAGLAADYRLAENWHLIPRYTHTRNVSNTELYDYTRNNLVLQLRWDFDNGKD